MLKPPSNSRDTAAVYKLATVCFGASHFAKVLSSLARCIYIKMLKPSKKGGFISEQW